MDKSVLLVLNFFHTYSGDSISLMVLGLSLALLILAWKSSGVLGLYVFQIVTLLSANIQVLRMGSTCLSAEPIALGTIAFATTYVAEDLINQQAGPKAAKKGIYLGLMAQLMFSLLMLSALAYQPQPGEAVYGALSFLFVPSLRLLCASLAAYYLSHLFNVQCFSYLQNYFSKCALWLRVSMCGWLSTLLDHFIFSWLAWKALASVAVEWHVLWFSYFFPSLFPRIVIALLVSPTLSLIQSNRHLRPETVHV